MVFLSGLEFLKAKFPKVYTLVESEGNKQQSEQFKLTKAVNPSVQTNIFTEYKNKKLIYIILIILKKRRNNF